MLSSEKQSHNYFHSLCVRPDVRFDSQHQDEQVILVLRRHPITQLGWILNSVILFGILLLINWFIIQFFTSNQIIVFNVFAFVFIFAYIWMNILIWLFNVGIVTDKRILDIDLYNAIYKEVTATKVDHVTDVTSKVGGFFGSLFQFGDVLVKTEGFQQNIEFADVPRPTDVVHIINDLIRHGPNN